MSIMHDFQDAYDNYIEDIRLREFPSLLNTTYLDHAGTTLYPQSLIDAYHQDLKANLYGNPHSESPASDLSTQRVEDARLAVLHYLKADPDHFDIVFTANATAAIKLVADCFRDQHFWYGFHKDAHSSIVGVREVAKLGSRCFTSNDEVDQWIDDAERSCVTSDLRLFAYPAQSNMTGHRLPLSWSSRIRKACSKPQHEQRIYVMLDAASYLTTGRLDLSDHEAAPDFISLSFYKIFGFPDLGALVVKKSAGQVLTQRRYFGGGTVDQVTVIGSEYYANKTSTIHDFLEDGTLPFHNITALGHAIAIHQRLFGSASAISRHTSQLSAWLYHQLSSLHHFNKTAVLQIHKEDSSTYGNPQTQGPIIAFSVLQSNGDYVGKSHFERLAIDCGFQLRTGGVCNPGGIATMLGLSHWELRRNFTEGARCGGDIDIVGGKPTGIIRVSLGPMSTMSDVSRFASFVEFFFVERSPPHLQHQEQGQDDPSFTPVEHCSPTSLKSMANASAHHVWNKQWCIVKPVAGQWQPIRPNEMVHGLSWHLEPEQGLLRIGQPNKPDLVVNLWERPIRDQTTTKPVSDARVFDVYIDQNTRHWFTSTLGFECTLARRHGEDARTLPQARTCIIPICKTAFPSKTELYQHYQAHAASFLSVYPSHKTQIRRNETDIQSDTATTDLGLEHPRAKVEAILSTAELSGSGSTVTVEDSMTEKRAMNPKRRGTILKRLSSIGRVFTQCWRG